MSNKVIIIAEAGVNHNGDIKLAKELIDVAALSGADIVKFQTFKTENLVTGQAAMADYQAQNTAKIQTQFEMLKKLELSEENFHELSVYAKEKNIGFFSTGFDLESLEFLKSMNFNMWKVPSGEITNRPYLEYIGKLNQPVIVSSGMCYLEEIEEAINVLINSGTSKDKITVLHCNTDYPSPYKDINLHAMRTIEEKLGVRVGYSDHTEGIEVSIAAVALGARVIEKHFTLNKDLEGPDHKASLNPKELYNLVKAIRNVEEALGHAEKIPSEGEFKNRAIARKSLVASREILEGEVFTSENITAKRPGTGISPMRIYDVLGIKAKKQYMKDDIIEL